ncbi:hypothetical protein JXD20_02695, partial [Candidatus Peregrinibacteria bacterium]|nr:hypothetical protein [Candidatus Peregrinibacteria bacterium]
TGPAPRDSNTIDQARDKGLQAIKAAERIVSLTPETVQRLQRDVVDKLMSGIVQFKVTDLKMVLEHLEQFRVDHQRLASILIETSSAPELVVANLENFRGLDQTKIITQLIVNERGDLIAANLDKFIGFDQPQAQARLAVALMINGQGEAVAKYLAHFKRLSHLTVARVLIQRGYGYSLALHFENFRGLDHSKVAQALIVAGEGASLAQYIEKFQGLDYPGLALQIVEHPAAKHLEYAKAFVSNLHKFPGADIDRIAGRLIDIGQGWLIEAFPNQFVGIHPATRGRLERDA